MNRKLTNAAIAALLLVPLAAISQDNAPAATPASDATAAGAGTVVFFRESKFVGGGMRYKVRENGIELCKLSNGSYCSVQVATGKHSYEVHSEAKDVLTLEVESGETYYVQG